MKKLTTLSFLIMLFSYGITHAGSSDLEDSSEEVSEDSESYENSQGEKFEPPTKRLKNSELSAEKDFESFEGGPYFHPPHARNKHFFGYEHKKDFFKDFKDDVLTENEDVTVCEGEDSEDAEGAVKLTFTCDDGDYVYSCYADLISSKYSVSIPSEVLGLSCTIKVEAVESTDDDSDIEVDGVETEDEVELDEESEVSIDVEE